jgi:hypothetical protein
MDRPGGGQEEPTQPDAQSQAAGDQPSELDRPERLELPAERRGYGEIDPDRISNEAILSFFGYDDDRDDLRRAQDGPEGERAGAELLEAAEETELFLSAKPSSELDGLENLSLEDLTPPRFRDRTGTSDVAAHDASVEQEQAERGSESTEGEVRHADTNDLDDLVPDSGEYAEADRPELTDAHVDAVEQHLARLDHSPANDAMTSRIREAIGEGRLLTEGERNFMTHELTEAELMDGGMPYEEAHGLAGQTHPPMKNYDPEVIEQFPELFNNNWRRTWGLETR